MHIVSQAILAFGAEHPGQTIALRGNHEDWLLQTMRSFEAHSWLLGMNGLDTIRSYSVEAAQALAEAGIAVDLFDGMPSVGRKFLLAGKGGLNLTHAEPFEAFAGRYGVRRAAIEPLLRDFDADALRAWAAGLGVDTFVGTSQRVFPADMKAAPLLRAWLQRLHGLGVRLHLRHRWLGWSGDVALREEGAIMAGGLRITEVERIVLDVPFRPRIRPWNALLVGQWRVVELVRVTTDAGFDSSPSWSPDGTTIAFTRYNTAQPETHGEDLMFVDVASGTVRRLELPGDQRSPVWSPDGQFLAFSATALPGRGVANLYTMRPDGTGIRLRTVNTAWGGGVTPSWIRR